MLLHDRGKDCGRLGMNRWWHFLLVACLAAGCGQRPAITAVAAPTNGAVRVVSLAPNLTEMICAIGAADGLVGRSSACRVPAEITQNVPVAGDFGAPSMESLVRCAPQIVVTVDLEDPNAAAAIRQLGIRCEWVPCRTLDDIPRALRTLGRLLRREDAARKLAGDIAGHLAALRRAPRPARPPGVFVEVWGDPLMTAGQRSFLTELIELAGGSNVVGDVARDFFPISTETVLARNPGVILLLEAPDAKAAAGILARRAGWAEIAAVRDGRVCSGLDRSLLEVPGPRVLESVKMLQECLLSKYNHD